MARGTPASRHDLGDVLGAEDVGLDRLERVVLADRHVLQRGGVDDHVGALDGATQPVAIADVTDEEAEPRVVELPLHLGLLELVAAEDADGGRIPLRERGAREMLAERARAPGQQDGPPLEMIHSRSSFGARMARWVAYGTPAAMRMERRFSGSVH